MTTDAEPYAWFQGAVMTLDKEVAAFWEEKGMPLTPLYREAPPIASHTPDQLQAAMVTAVDHADRAREARLAALKACLAIVNDEREKDFPDIRSIRDQISNLIHEIGDSNAQE